MKKRSCRYSFEFQKYLHKYKQTCEGVHEEEVGEQDEEEEEEDEKRKN